MRPDPHARALHAIVRDLMNTRDGATYAYGGKGVGRFHTVTISAAAIL